MKRESFESRESGPAGVDAAARAESLLLGGLISFFEAAGCQSPRASKYFPASAARGGDSWESS